MAGFHVNSSTYRTAAVHNRLLKIITGVNTDKIKELDDEAGAKYKQWAGGQQWKRDQLKKVSEEANHLKHTDEGIFSKRGLTYHYAVIAIDQILTITEVWNQHDKKNAKA